MNHWPIVPLLLPLIGGMLNLLLTGRHPRTQRIVSLVCTAGVLAVSLYLLGLAHSGVFLVYCLGDWAAPFGIVLVLDRLSALLLFTTGVLGLLTLLYALAGDDRRGHNFHIFFPLQLLGINGAFLTGDLFNLFVFFEILLIASYCLALHGGGPARIRAGLHYVVLNLIGSALFLLAIGTLYGLTGTLNLADLAVRVAASAPRTGSSVPCQRLPAAGGFRTQSSAFAAAPLVASPVQLSRGPGGCPIRHHNQSGAVCHPPHLHPGVQ